MGIVHVMKPTGPGGEPAPARAGLPSPRRVVAPAALLGHQMWGVEVEVWLPWTVQELSPPVQRRWRDHYTRPGRGRNPQVEEGLWRRTQDRRNAAWSGWQEPGDARRRLWHYRFAFDMAATGQLAVTEVYLYFHVALPDPEAAVQYEAVCAALDAGGWQRTGGAGDNPAFRRGDLTCRIRWAGDHPGDHAVGRSLPARYRHLDVRVSNTFTCVTRSQLPWQILAAGFRTPDRRGHPEIVTDLSALADLAPFQAEVGCGLSVEAGIPPLHQLHEIYQVSDPHTHRFVLDPDTDQVMASFLADPEGFRNDEGRFIPYPLEGPQDGDLLCRLGATDALVPLAQAITGEDLTCPASST